MEENEGIEKLLRQGYQRGILLEAAESMLKDYYGCKRDRRISWLAQRIFDNPQITHEGADYQKRFNAVFRILQLFSDEEKTGGHLFSRELGNRQERRGPHSFYYTSSGYLHINYHTLNNASSWEFHGNAKKPENTLVFGGVTNRWDVFSDIWERYKAGENVFDANGEVELLAQCSYGWKLPLIGITRIMVFNSYNQCTILTKEGDSVKNLPAPNLRDFYLKTRQNGSLVD